MSSKKIDSQAVLYNVVGTDEAYTPDYGVKPIIEYIEQYRDRAGYSSTNILIVWCPFDKVESEFVKQISAIDSVNVTYSHIEDGQDFFTYEPDKWDIIVSNPPFKNKRKFFERAIAFNKPFALIMTNAWLNDSSSKTVFSEAGAQPQLLMFDNRMKFTNPDGRPNDKITFSSSYFCRDLLPTDLILGGKLLIPKKVK